MAYNELMKDFTRTRDYMREFFVHGFKSREEIEIKSARSYDNERRRIESWLDDAMAFRQSETGKRIFISVDSRSVARNPLHKAWQSKSFTKNDITLHFWLMDILAVDRPLSLSEILERIDAEYLAYFEGAEPIDESTVRKKLREYTGLGLIAAQKRGKQLHYALPADEVNLKSWLDAIAYFTGENPLGVIGSFMLDRDADPGSDYAFKHNYLLFALDSGIVLNLLTAINEKRMVEVDVFSRRRRANRVQTVVPLKLFASTQTGRQYLAAHNTHTGKMLFYRVDTIKSAAPMGEIPDYDRYAQDFGQFCRHLWGAAVGTGYRLEHVEMTIQAEPGERFVAARLEREKRLGEVEQIAENRWIFRADVYDAQELLPWVRSFTGRIVSFRCSNKAVERRFYDDLAAMAGLYGGETDAL